MDDTRGHVRLAVAADGDDITFSRYVKVKGPKRAKPARGRQRKLPGLAHPKIAQGRTLFAKSVKQADEMRNLLVSGHSNVKIGRDARIGKLKGYWIYTLSLEERATCPRSCFHWQSCYGNNMPYAKRVDHRSPDFLARLEAEIANLCAPPRDGRGGRRMRKGVIIRLHALGDFYSTDYVLFWERMLRKHANLVIFGYTAWAPDSPIGIRISTVIDLHPGRFMLRFSNGGLRTRSTVPIVRAEDRPPGAFVCPEQTGQFDACGKCGACWATLKNVAFIEH